MITIGSDVEFFVKDTKRNRIVSAEGYVPGTKRDPFRFSDNRWFATQLDNVLAEGNIPPATSAQEFVGHIGTLRKHLDSVLSAHNLTTWAAAAHRFNPDQLETENARNFGCDPSFCAWDGSMAEVHLQDPCLRSAGFHIHVGYDGKLSEAKNREIAKAMDLFLGVPAVLLDPLGDVRRLGGYGAAGNFRHQDWGVEYRTLSSHFTSHPALVAWAFENAERAYEAAEQGLIPCDPVLRDGSMIVETINLGSKLLAKRLVADYGIPMPKGA